MSLNDRKPGLWSVSEQFTIIKDGKEHPWWGHKDGEDGKGGDH